jgi:hypothetical protein
MSVCAMTQTTILYERSLLSVFWGHQWLLCYHFFFIFRRHHDYYYFLCRGHRCVLLTLLLGPRARLAYEDIFFLENEKAKNIDSKDDLKKKQFIKKPAQSRSQSIMYWNENVMRRRFKSNINVIDNLMIQISLWTEEHNDNLKRHSSRKQKQLYCVS